MIPGKDDTLFPSILLIFMQLAFLDTTSSLVNNY